MLSKSAGSSQGGYYNKRRSGSSGLIYGQISGLILARRSLYQGSQSSERVRVVFVVVDAMVNASNRGKKNRSNCGDKWMIIDSDITGLYGHSGLIIVK